jgi:hypothetical protein
VVLGVKVFWFSGLGGWVGGVGFDKNIVAAEVRGARVGEGFVAAQGAEGAQGVVAFGEQAADAGDDEEGEAGVVDFGFEDGGEVLEAAVVVS